MSMDTKPISVMLIENHPLMRAALSDAIENEPDLHLVAEVSNVVEAIQMASTQSSDVILAALGDNEYTGLASLTTLRGAFPTACILALVNESHNGLEVKTLKAGAQALLSKTTPRSELLKTLKKALTYHISSAQNNPEIHTSA